MKYTKFLLATFLLMLLAACSSKGHTITFDDFQVCGEQIELILQSKYELKAKNSELEKQVQNLNNYIFEIQSQADTSVNSQHQIFYGEWRATDHIFMPPMQVRGHLLSYEEIKENIATFAESIRGETIRFSRDYVAVNDSQRINDMHYLISIYPSDDFFSVDLMLTFADIGLSESVGSYFAHVVVQMGNNIGNFPGNEFFVKDINTLIVLRGNMQNQFFVEYERIAF